MKDMSIHVEMDNMGYFKNIKSQLGLGDIESRTVFTPITEFV